MSSPGLRRVKLCRIAAEDGSQPAFEAVTADWVAVEEPLQIRIAEEPLTTTMRTPGHDRELALGYLRSEGLIRSLSDVGSMSVCGKPGDPDYGNVLEVTPAPGHDLKSDPLAQSARRNYTSSACGVCGRQSIEDLRSLCVPLDSTLRCSVSQIRRLLSELPLKQRNFGRSGGVHAAGIAKADATWIAVFEDIGRHNAVDKALGHALLTTAEPDILMVSSRAGFEIVHKACVARVPIVICLSAASSLAIETAAEFGLTLLGFARGDSLNVYTGSARIVP